MKIAYADPPYIGCAHLYRDHPDYAGEVDHVRLIERLDATMTAGFYTPPRRRAPSQRSPRWSSGRARGGWPG
ncbi:hypothetical protein [Paracoccus versutus]|uniref:hypothetical protein n=1 Tax=Paracoccus versutus TaxID=34007 RepID=UPI001FCB0EEC|nr:hypothetical protein [Paracoccus versutus]